MLYLSNYQTISNLYESANSIVYRAMRLQDKQPVILKVLKEDYPSPIELSHYRQEYEIVRNLNSSSIIKTYALEKHQNSLIIVLEDFGGISLRQWLNSGQFSSVELLTIAVQIVASLSDIYTANIIHKDINPTNIVYNPNTGQLKLIDFGIASILPRENPILKNPTKLEGTLAYMSPEQTGRMNCDLDYRTDFYAFGITLYEMFTGRLPFSANDTMELVHCHLAKQPIAPKEMNPDIPTVISDIIMKLMEKAPEMRYQSPWGIRADLENCLHQLHNNGNIIDFPLAGTDISDRFQIPQKLYGRAAEVAVLEDAIERVSQGYSEMLLITGYAGVGKSALVREIYKPLTQKRGYFIAGKFDQLQRNVPYSAVVTAFRDLIQQLLTEDETRLANWREQLIASFGTNGQVIIDVIPEIALIVGVQPQLATLGPAESQNRFILVFQNFIRVFCQPSHPLVIFLDDLHWADRGSLKLMTLMMRNIPYLLLIGAYRDNEVGQFHPLQLIIKEIEQSNAQISTLSLGPLVLPCVNQFIADTLHTSPERTFQLAELILAKTNGNPFFMKEFLKSLYTDKLLKFVTPSLETVIANEPQEMIPLPFNIKGGWQWDLSQIEAQGITDNVVELLIGKLKRLKLKTQEVLKLAACIGNYFDLPTLAIVHKKKLSETFTDLLPALEAGLILPTSPWQMEEIEAYSLRPVVSSNEAVLEDALPLLIYHFKFLHDRVQQAAYTLLDEEQKKSAHLLIGRVLLGDLPEEEQVERIFDIVNQINLGIELVTHPLARQEFAELNFIAGRRAKMAAAYETAFNYFRVGIQLLSTEAWKKQYQLMLTLHVEAAEAAYLNGDFAEMERLCEIVLNRAKNLLDKVKVYEVKIQAYVAHNDPLNALKMALTVLDMLGIRFPKKWQKIHIVIGILKTKMVLRGHKISNLIDLPPMTHPLQLAAMRILPSAATVAFLTVPTLLPLIVFKLVRLSVKYGNSPETSQAYASYALILCGVVGDIETGHQFGELALQLVEHYHTKHLKARTLMLVNIFVKHWKEHIKETLEPLLEAYQTGLETGDLEYGGYSIFMYLLHCYFIGRDLHTVVREMTTYGNTIAQLRQKSALNYNNIYTQAVLNLMGKSKNVCVLQGEVYNEEEMLPLHHRAKDKTAVFTVHLNKLMLNYLFGSYAQAYENACEAEKYLLSVTALVVVPVFYFYDSLVRTALYPKLSKAVQRRFLRKIKSNQRKLKHWSRHAPMNHLHKFYLVKAEIARILGKEVEARAYYDEAIVLAQKNDFLNEQALAHELAGRFYLDKGLNQFSHFCLHNAYYCYLRWGALAKIKDLEENYPRLFIRHITTKYTISESRELLDLHTILKASQTISEEIVLDKLLTKLMKIVVENAGAQKGCLLLVKENKLFIEVEQMAEPPHTKVHYGIPLSSSQNLPLTLIHYVERTLETVVLNEATLEGRFTRDPYIISHKPKSILCLPIFQHNQLVSIIYLENNLTSGAFTSNHLEVLKVLSAQSAISIQNARLYQQQANYSRTLEEKVSERTEALQRANQELHRLATLDGLTQIANRRRFDEYLQQSWHRLARDQAPLSLILCDIDYFKRYNDTYGHQAGDDCLKQVAQAITHAIHRPCDLVARYGGEEFVVILPGTTSKEALRTAEAMQENVRQLKLSHVQSTVSPYVTLSIGVANIVPNVQPPTLLIKMADESLYEAKANGRNCIVFKTSDANCF